MTPIQERFPPSILRHWKQEAESSLLEEFKVVETRAKPINDFLLELPSELVLVVNVRFGFSFFAPDQWNRFDSHNGDGSTFSHPDDSEIEIRAWAGYAVFDANLESYIERTMGYARDDGYFELINLGNTTRSVSNISPESPNGPPTQVPVKAARLVYRSGKFSYFHIMTRVAGTNFDIRCQVPVERFAEFRDLFILVSNSLRVLGTSMASTLEASPRLRTLAAWNQCL